MKPIYYVQVPGRGSGVLGSTDDYYALYVVPVEDPGGFLLTAVEVDEPKHGGVDTVRSKEVQHVLRTIADQLVEQNADAGCWRTTTTQFVAATEAERERWTEAGVGR